MDNIVKVITGSQLHGLAGLESDTDIRGIHIHSVKDILSPYKKIKNTSWIEGDVDNTSYELSDFCKIATQGNPNILEVLFSDMIEEETDAYKEMRANRSAFLDSKRIYEASKGYCHNQYKKMNLFEPDKRTPKFAVAYIRTLHQMAQLLRTGTFECRITGELKDELRQIKYHYEEFDKKRLVQLFEEKMQGLNEAYCENHDRFTPDIEWIEDFIYRTYTNN